LRIAQDNGVNRAELSVQRDLGLESRTEQTRSAESGGNKTQSRKRNLKKVGKVEGLEEGDQVR